MKLTTGNTVRFIQGNVIPFGMDHGFWRGIPGEIDFRIADVWGASKTALVKLETPTEHRRSTKCANCGAGHDWLDHFIYVERRYIEATLSEHGVS